MRNCVGSEHVSRVPHQCRVPPLIRRGQPNVVGGARPGKLQVRRQRRELWAAQRARELQGLLALRGAVEELRHCHRHRFVG